MQRSQGVTDIVVKAMNIIHKAALKVSGGRLGKNLLGMRSVELHTVGRKSGKAHDIMLTAPIHDDSRYVLIASKGGDDRHPDWYRNLMAKPDASLTFAGETLKIHARTATPEEKATLWPEIVKAYKHYDGYQKRTDRDIPVVICELQ